MQFSGELVWEPAQLKKLPIFSQIRLLKGLMVVAQVLVASESKWEEWDHGSLSLKLL